MKEKKETPQYEAKSHSLGFLKKAVTAKSAAKLSRKQAAKIRSAAGAAY